MVTAKQASLLYFGFPEAVAAAEAEAGAEAEVPVVGLAVLAVAVLVVAGQAVAGKKRSSLFGPKEICFGYQQIISLTHLKMIFICVEVLISEDFTVIIRWYSLLLPLLMACKV